MVTAIKHPVPDRVKPSLNFVIYDTQALQRSDYIFDRFAHFLITEIAMTKKRN